MKTGIRVLDAMTRKPITVDPDRTLDECARIMTKNAIGNLLVVDKSKKDRLLGILTEKDFVTKVIARGINPSKFKAKDIMETKLKVIEPEADIYDALIRMRQRKVRRLPVVEKGRLIGLLTDKDVLRIEPQLFDLMVEKFMVKELFRKKKLTSYMEGDCEICGNYAQLYELGDQLICEGCLDQAK